MVLREHLISKGLIEALVFDSSKVNQELARVYNDSIVQCRRALLQAYTALADASGRDKARSKKAAPTIKKLDDMIKLLKDKDIVSALTI